jgi:integrase
MKLPKAVKLKSGVYRIQLKLGGKSVMVYGDTEAQARKQALLVKSEHLAGKVVQTKCRYTVTQAIDKYIADHKLSPSTVRGYRCIQATVFRDAMQMNAGDVNWQRMIDNDAHAPKTIKNAWGFIASVLKHVGISPPNVTLPQVVKNERPFLQPEQIPKFLDAIRGQNCEIAALLGLHSLRRSEILDMTYGDVDLNSGVLHVRGAAVLNADGELIHKSENKNAASTRDVPIMIPRLTEILSKEPEMHKPDDYLVTTYPNGIYKDINRICAANGLPEVGVHGLRHSMVSLSYHLGWSELATMKVAGYSDYNTMRKIYTHLADEDKKKNVAAMQKFFAAN